MRAATTRSSSSPTGWPNVSLTPLKPSRSMNIADASIPSRRAWTSICSARSMISARLGRPVSASCSAWWRSWPVFSSTIRSARARPRASTCTSRNASRPSAIQITSTRNAWTSGSDRPAGSALVTVTVQRPSASTEIRLRQALRPRDRAVAGRGRGASSTPRACGTPGRHGSPGTAACSRSSVTATLALAPDRRAQDRLGVEQADDPAGGQRAALADACAARRRRGRPGRRPRTSRGRGWR